MQILDDLCHWDATKVVPNLEYAAEYYAPDIIFVEAPDYVFEGWGFNKYLDGDDRFIKPTPPEGWVYDDRTGTFYREGFDELNPTDRLEELMTVTLDHI